MERAVSLVARLERVINVIQDWELKTLVVSLVLPGNILPMVVLVQVIEFKGALLKNYFAIACPIGCTQCTSATSCSTCAPGYSKPTGANTVCTSDGKPFKKKSFMIFLGCSLGCIDCSSGPGCTTCAFGYFKSGSNCQGKIL